MLPTTLQFRLLLWRMRGRGTGAPHWQNAQQNQRVQTNQASRHEGNKLSRRCCVAGHITDCANAGNGRRNARFCSCVLRGLDKRLTAVNGRASFPHSVFLIVSCRLLHQGLGMAYSLANVSLMAWRGQSIDAVSKNVIVLFFFNIVCMEACPHARTHPRKPDIYNLLINCA